MKHCLINDSKWSWWSPDNLYKWFKYALHMIRKKSLQNFIFSFMWNL